MASPEKEKNPHAVMLGAMKSLKKAKASRENGKKGGRPKTKVVELQQCTTCPMLISKHEYEAGEGSCFKCWEK